jgi:hypothetical protein
VGLNRKTNKKAKKEKQIKRVFSFLFKALLSGLINI